MGSGANLSTSLLSTGAHVITLTATDSNGMSSQAQRKIVVADENFVEPLHLDVAPFGVGVVAVFGSAPQDVDVSLLSSGDTEIDWTAAEDIPWLSVATNAGQTPVDLVLTVDPSLLPLGTHIGTITFTSPQAANSPVVLTVNLQVTGNKISLPLIGN